MCISAVTVAEAARADRGTTPGCCRSRSSASSQPPTASGRNCWATPRVAFSGAAVVLVPARAAARCSGSPAAVRKRSTSSSGLIPGSSLRNTFSTSSSSNTIEEFDCSTPIRRTLRVLGDRPRPRRRGGNEKLPSAVSISSVDSIRRISSSSARGLGQRVVHGPIAVWAIGLPGVVLARAGSTQQQRQLVELVRAGGEPRLHERDEQQRILAQRDPLDDLDPGHRARLRRVPALLLDPLAQALLVEALAELARPGSEPGQSSDPPSPALPRPAGTRRSRAGASVSRYGSSPIRGKRERPNSSTG